MSRGGSRYGAGRPAWHAKTGGMLQIDVRKLRRGGHLTGPQRMTWRWTNGATICIAIGEEAVTLTYRYKDRDDEWRDVDQRVGVINTPCHYGGSRPWFACPRCGRRVAILYLWNVPLCRKCARLAYPSQSEDAIDRSWGRTYRIMKRLGQADEGSYALPRRPKGMRRATFDHLWEAWWREEDLRDEAIAQFATRLGVMLGDTRSP